MSQIWKYELESTTVLKIPGNPNFLCVGLDPTNRVCIWMEVDTEAEEGNFSFRVVGTGHEVPVGTYLGTVTKGSLVLHVYTE